MMHMYLLQAENEQVVEDFSPIWGLSRVWVRGGKWYDARAKAIQHAVDNGYGGICVVTNTVQLYRKPHWNGRGEEVKPYLPTKENKHGLWVYLNRLLCRYGHVYVPSLGWASHKFEQECNPPIPLVAAYRTTALQELDNTDIPFGKLLCGKGYDSFTINDYYYHDLGNKVTLDEPGSMTTWRNAYGRAIARKLGLQE